MKGAFWSAVSQHNATSVAIRTDDNVIKYSALNDKISDWVTRLCADTERPLVALAMGNRVSAVACYLACLQCGFPVILFNPVLSDAGKQTLLDVLSPNLLIDDEHLYQRHSRTLALDKKLAVILSTSGSTGGGKFVALSYQNLAANTRSICSYLPVETSDTTLLTMPLSYSYGLSVLNTHLAMGAAIRMTDMTVMDRGFWELLKEEAISSLSGVPSFYDMLLRLRFTRQKLPALRYFTQAGGRLSETHIKVLAEYADNHNKLCFIMYGQTEATARMAYLSPKQVAKKPAAIGRAIPGGSLSLQTSGGDIIKTPGVPGELIYQGDNVMLGYVSCCEELVALSPRNTLHTGDLAVFDEDGDFFITGRLKRIIKLFGERLSLDGLEALFARTGTEVRVTGEDNLLIVACLPADEEKVHKNLKSLVNFPPAARVIMVVADWPLLANGKVDYQALLQHGKQQ